MARHCIQWRYAIGGAVVAALVLAMPQAMAQEATPDGGAQLRGAFPPDTGRIAPSPVVPGPTLPANTTVVPRAPAADGTVPTGGQVNLVALLTVDGQRIDKGLVWRIFASTRDPRAAPNLVMTKREASPTIELDPGEYIVNAHMYRGVNVTYPVPVKITVNVKRDSSKTATPVATTTVELRKANQELTALRFRLDSNGELMPGSVNSLFKGLRVAAAQ